jgi:HSP20 family protein
MNFPTRRQGDRNPNPLARTRDLVGNLWDNLVPRRRGRQSGNQPPFSWPSLEVSEDDKAVRVDVEAPGLSPKDIDVSFADGALNIRGERKQEREAGKRDYHYRESWYGAFSRSVPIEANVDWSKAKADFKHGILKINIPKKTGSTATRRITIT